MKIVIATNNKRKIKEIKEILKEISSDLELLTLEDVGINYDVEETGLSFEKNSIKKAKEYYELCKIPVIAEDSGLCIEAFNNLPGIFSKRIFGNKTDEELNNIIIENMKGVENRNAKFEAFYTYYDGKNIITSVGYIDGKILDTISGENGFSYDKIFYSNELNKRLSECTNEEKNSISHRRYGLKKIFKKIKNVYNI